MKRVAVISLLALSLVMSGCKVSTHVTGFDGNTTTTTKEKGVTKTVVTDKDGNIISEEITGPSDQVNSGSSSSSFSADDSSSSSSSSFGVGDSSSSGSYTTQSLDEFNSSSSGSDSIYDGIGSSSSDDSYTSSDISYFDASTVEFKNYGEQSPGDKLTKDELFEMVDLFNDSGVTSPLEAYQTLHGAYSSKYSETEIVYIVNHYIDYDWSDVLDKMMQYLYESGGYDITSEEVRQGLDQEFASVGYTEEQINEGFRRALSSINVY